MGFTEKIQAVELLGNSNRQVIDRTGLEPICACNHLLKKKDLHVLF